MMKEKRVKEKDIVKPALKIIYDNPGINTSELIIELQKVVELYPGDKEILKNRTDNKFSQIVRNLISHRERNEFGKCISSQEGRNDGFYINGKGRDKIRGYETKEVKEEVLDGELQRKIRESRAYDTDELKLADEREPEQQSKSSLKYKTDARISKTVLKENGYICEIELITGDKHKTFDTNGDVQYMEGHHLVPIKAQKYFSNNIDRSVNICCLCPNCHRAIHYGTINEKRKRLKLLYNHKIEKLKLGGIDISFEDLINKYYL